LAVRSPYINLKPHPSQAAVTPVCFILQ